MATAVFKDWVASIDKDPRLFVEDIHVQSLDMFGPRVGFVKFMANSKVMTSHEGSKRVMISVPGIV